MALSKKTLFSYALSLLFILAILFFIDLNAALIRISSFGLTLFFFLCALNFISFIFRGIRWQKLVKPFTQLKSGESIYMLFVSFLGNYILPAKVGDFIRAFLLSEKKAIGKTRALSTVVVDRLADGIVLVALVSTSLLFLENAPLQLKQVVLLPAALCGLMLGCFVFPKTFLNSTSFLLRFNIKLQEKITNFLNELIQAHQSLRQGKKELLIIFSFSLFIWLIYSLIVFLAAENLGIILSLPQTICLAGLTALGFLIPSAPGNIGTFEASFIVIMLFFGFTASSALALGLIVHLINYATILPAGLVSLHRLDVFWGKLTKLSKQERSLENL